MLKLACKTPLNFMSLADRHFETLNQKVSSGKRKGEYYVDSVIYKLDQEILNHTGEEKRFFEFLKGRNHSKLKEILCGMPEVLKTVIDDFNHRFTTLAFREQNQNGKWVFNSLGEKVSKIFNYENYRKSDLCIANLQALGINFTQPCPYCNCDPLSIVKITEHTTARNFEKALLDLDHFFTKSKFPFLAISLFNLVPSCHNCNSRSKGIKEFELDTHVQPFSKSFDDLFTFSLAKPYLDGQKPDDLEIVCENRAGVTFPKNSISDLEILERYNAHRPQLINMLAHLNKRPYENFSTLFPAADVLSLKLAYYNIGQIPVARTEISSCTLGKLKIDLLDHFFNTITA
jgi:hypothetical protein